MRAVADGRRWAASCTSAVFLKVKEGSSSNATECSRRTASMAACWSTHNPLHVILSRSCKNLFSGIMMLEMWEGNQHRRLYSNNRKSGFFVSGTPWIHMTDSDSSDFFLFSPQIHGSNFRIFLIKFHLKTPSGGDCIVVQILTRKKNTPSEQKHALTLTDVKGHSV